MLPRRRLLAASVTTVPVFAALAGCAGPDPLSGPPPLSPDVRVLFGAVTAETGLVSLYSRTISAYSALAPALRPLLAQHQAHLDQLRARIIEPAGGKAPSQSAAASPAAGGPAVPATKAAAVARLSTAEHAAVTAQLRRLRGSSPALAQLYASIAASEATHVSALAILT